MKQLLISGVAFALALQISAPKAYGQAVRMGVKAGATYSTLIAPSLQVPDRRGGFQAGVWAQVPVTPNPVVYLQPELLYSAKGARTPFLTGELQWRLQYLELPVLLGVVTHGFFVQAGPQLSYLLSAKQESTARFTPVAPQYTSFLVGYAAGLGYQLPMGLSATLRYSSDLQQATSNRERNSVYQVQVGYLFGKPAQAE